MSYISPDEFEQWLAAHHASADEVWVRYPRGTSRDRLSELLDAALSYGWIDAVRKSLDERAYLQRYTKRRARSKWSKLNVERAEALIARGAMRPAGLAEVERAKADGRWDAAYHSPSTMPVPDDLQAELDARPAAAAAFAALNSTNRYAILYRLHDAKKQETRARRLAKFVALLERGETLY